MFKTTSIAAAALIATTSMASAGGLSDQIVEAPVEPEPMMADAAPSVNPTIVVVGIIGALLLAASLDDDSGSTETETIESTGDTGSAGDE